MNQVEEAVKVWDEIMDVIQTQGEFSIGSLPEKKAASIMQMASILAAAVIIQRAVERGKV